MKQLWEMTRKEYDATDAVNTMCYDIARAGWLDEGKVLPPPMGKEPWEMTADEFREAEELGYVIDFVGIRSGEEILAFCDKYRSDFVRAMVVEQALRDGKTVPHHVLKDFAGEPWAKQALASCNLL